MADVDDAREALEKLQQMRIADKHFHIYARKTPGPILGAGSGTGRPMSDETDEG